MGKGSPNEGRSMIDKIDRYDEEQHNDPMEHDLGPHPTATRVRSYLRDHPFWTSKDGQVFETVQDVEDDHLMNLVPFISSRAHGLDMLMKNILDDDQRNVIEKRAELLRGKAKACIEEADRRKLLV